MVWVFHIASCPGIIGALEIISTVWESWFSTALGGPGEGSYLLPLLNILPSCLVCVCGGGGVSYGGRAFWYLHLWWDRLVWDTLGSLSIERLLGRSEIERELYREIFMETWLVLFPSLSGISTCSGYLDIDSSGVLFYRSQSGDLPGDRGIDQEIWSSLMISIGRSWERLGVWFGDRGGYRIGLVVLVLISSSGNSIGQWIAWEIGSSINRGYSGISTCCEIAW